jgi:ribosomal protein L37AE/L43A
MSGKRGPGDGEPVGVPSEPGPVDEGWLDTPNCPVCLNRMEAVETERGGVHWACSVCGQTLLA